MYWHKVKNQLPPENKPVLFCWGNARLAHHPCAGFRAGDKYTVYDHPDQEWGDPTYWVELPELDPMEVHHVCITKNKVRAYDKEKGIKYGVIITGYDGELELKEIDRIAEKIFRDSTFIVNEMAQYLEVPYGDI